MKVANVETLVLRGTLDAGYQGVSAYAGRYIDPGIADSDLSRAYPLRSRIRHPWREAITTCLVRITTDDGITGIGESKGVVAPEAVKAYIDGYLREAIVGENPLYTRVLWDRMYAFMRARGHLQGFHQEAAAGIDIALWDIAGKVTGRSISELLGGRYRERIRVYYSALGAIADAHDPEGESTVREETRLALRRGFNAVKIVGGSSVALDLRTVELVREAGGGDLLILYDAQGCYDYPQALRLAHALADAGVGWCEAPLPPEDIDGYVRLSQQAPIPIANDLIWTAALYKEFLMRGARIVVQPETIKVGITECARLAELADVFGCAYAPHMSIGSVIQFASTTHVAASAPNFLISEYWAGQNRLGDAILRTPLEFAGGALTVPTGPGLGIELNPEALAAVAQTGEPRS